MKKPPGVNGFMSQGIALSCILVFSLVTTSCSARLQEGEISSRLYPTAPYEYTLNGKKYFFLAGKATYQDVINEIGVPDQSSLTTILGENKDGTKFITYRTISNLSTRLVDETASLPEMGKSSGVPQNSIQIRDATFRFNEQELLISAGLTDMSKDKDALADWDRRKQAIEITEKPFPDTGH